MVRTVAFASACPRCRRQRPQEFTLASLLRLLQGGHPVEAYCGSCGEFWEIGQQKRLELNEVVAAAEGGALLARQGSPSATAH